MATAYEAIFILDPSMTDEQLTATIEKYQGVVTRSEGTIDDTDRWDVRRLAYPIKKKREGLYVVMNFTAPATAKDELDRIFRISDDTLRHIIVKQDKRANRFPSQARAADRERREREMAARMEANAGPGPVTDLGAAAPVAPVVETAPAEETAVAMEDTTPVTEETTTAAEEATPVEETATPVEETTTPVEESTETSEDTKEN